MTLKPAFSQASRALCWLSLRRTRLGFDSDLARSFRAFEGPGNRFFSSTTATAIKCLVTVMEVTLKPFHMQLHRNAARTECDNE